MNDLVSIVLPTYNGEKFLRQAIDSCLNQTYKNIELIIVNDGSTDNTEKIITSFKDKRIKYLKHKQNRGLPEALNTGFSVAKGNYLTWASDDNYYAKHAIETMMRVRSEEAVHFVYCNFYKFNGKVKLVKLPDKPYGRGACFLYTKKVKETIGEYDPESFLAEDYDYWIRVSKKFEMHHYKYPLLYYRLHPESLFSKKRFEIEIVAILVRLKHSLIGVDEATKQFIENKVNKKLYKLRIFSILGIRFLPTFLLALLLKKIYLHTYDTKRVREIFREYIINKDFKMAKDKLKEMMK